MKNEKSTPVEDPVLKEMLEGLDEGRRQLLKLALAGAAAYTVPLMASFSMDSLAIAPALAFVGNQTDPGNQITPN